MKQLRILALTIAILFAVGSLPLASGTQAQSSVEEEIIRLEKAVYDAVRKRDVATLESYFADDFTEIRAHGLLYNKAQILYLFKTVEGNVERYDVDNIKVRIYGETAVVTGRYARKGFTTNPARTQKSEYDEQGLYTSVWVKRQGRWQLVAMQDTNSPQQVTATKPQPAAPMQGQPVFPIGIYTAKNQQGTWMMEFKSNGTVTVKRDDVSLAPDITYTIKNDQIEVRAVTSNVMCSGTGTYKWAFDGKALTFQLVSEPNCPPRQAVMTGNKFIKQ